VTVTCGGDCAKDTDCPTLAGCFCEISDSVQRVGAEGLQLPGQCRTAVCGGPCVKDSDCEPATGCVCDENEGLCITVGCGGTCQANSDCPEDDGCVCFLGVNTADAVAVDAVIAEGFIAQCGACRTTGQSCAASSECCGQLVCLSGGTCGHKPRPKPNRRCHKHGGSCHSDHDCCAQGSCYKGQCGEKDTHCNNDGECAQGYRCVGGPLAPSHRRCRKNGRRKRNKTQRRHG
jgi:hypothetical protein